ncbi:MAG: hypothetical protein HOK61_02600 [Alphaproteobacteria bacterium]|jgi:hypothetical protein|nr:hypothetical protein [Alphaproteobacteria bacterium]
MMFKKTLLGTVLAIGLAAAATGTAMAHGSGDAHDKMRADGQGSNTMMMQDGQQGMTGPMMKQGGRHGMKMHGRHGSSGGQNMGPLPLMTLDQATAQLEAMLSRHNSQHIKVGGIEIQSDFAIRAEIVTKDGSLVHILVVDRRDGQVYVAE